MLKAAKLLTGHQQTDTLSLWRNFMSVEKTIFDDPKTDLNDVIDTDLKNIISIEFTFQVLTKFIETLKQKTVHCTKLPSLW